MSNSLKHLKVEPVHDNCTAKHNHVIHTASVDTPQSASLAKVQRNPSQIILTQTTTNAKSALDYAFAATAQLKKWTPLGTASKKKDSGVWIVWESETQCRRVIRLSVRHPNQFHAASAFASFWSTRSCRFLPHIEPPQTVSWERKFEKDAHPAVRMDFVLENYECLGDPINNGLQDLQSCLVRKDLDLFNSDMRWMYIYDAICGVVCLQGQNWCHGDLSLENVVVGEQISVLIDFESSFQYDPSRVYPVRGLGPSKQHYRPPEMDDQDSFLFAQHVDVWSLGVMMFATAANCLPFAEDPVERAREMEFIKKYGFRLFVLNSLGLDVYKQLGSLLVDLLEQIFVVFDSWEIGGGDVMYGPSDDRFRISAKDMLCDPFFQAFF